MEGGCHNPKSKVVVSHLVHHGGNRQNDCSDPTSAQNGSGT